MSVLEVLGLIFIFVLFYIGYLILSNAASDWVEKYFDKKEVREKEQRKAEFEEWLKETKLKEEER